MRSAFTPRASARARVSSRELAIVGALRQWNEVWSAVVCGPRAQRRDLHVGRAASPPRSRRPRPSEDGPQRCPTSSLVSTPIGIDRADASRASAPSIRVRGEPAARTLVRRATATSTGAAESDVTITLRRSSVGTSASCTSSRTRRSGVSRDAHSTSSLTFSVLPGRPQTSSVPSVQSSAPPGRVSRSGEPERGSAAVRGRGPGRRNGRSPADPSSALFHGGRVRYSRPLSWLRPSPRTELALPSPRSSPRPTAP